MWNSKNLNLISMRRKGLVFACTTVLSAAVAYSIASSETIELSALQLQNVELLTLNENPNVFNGYELVNCYEEGTSHLTIVGAKCIQAGPEFDCDSSRTWGNCKKNEY